MPYAPGIACPGAWRFALLAIIVPVDIASASEWQVVDGQGCEQTADGCIQTLGYPDFYVPPSRCRIEAASNNTKLIVWDTWSFGYAPYEFQTYMTVNGDVYNSMMSLWITAVAPRGDIVFRDDHASNTAFEGWRLCLHDSCAAFDCPAGWRLRPDAAEVACADSRCESNSSANVEVCCAPTCYIPEAAEDAQLRGPNCSNRAEPKSIHDCQIVCPPDQMAVGSQDSVIAPTCNEPFGNWSVPDCFLLDSDDDPGYQLGVQITGDCQLWSPSCIASPNFPAQYPKNSHCLISVLKYSGQGASPPTSKVEFIKYDTHAPRDYLSWPGSGAAYGTAMYDAVAQPPPDMLILNSGGALEWSSDGSQQGVGFLFCIYTQCETYICPLGFTFNCSSAQEYCSGSTCTDMDTATCCVVNEDFNGSGYEPYYWYYLYDSYDRDISGNGTDLFKRRSYEACFTTTTTTTIESSFMLVGFLEFRMDVDDWDQGMPPSHGPWMDMGQESLDDQQRREVLESSFKQHVETETGLSQDLVFAMAGPAASQPEPFPTAWQNFSWILGYEIGPLDRDAMVQHFTPDNETSIQIDSIEAYVDLANMNMPIITEVLRHVKMVSDVFSNSHIHATLCHDYDELSYFIQQRTTTRTTSMPFGDRRQLQDTSIEVITHELWRNDFGVTCNRMEEFQLCARHGGPTELFSSYMEQTGLNTTWADFSMGDDGSAADSCCACGGGICTPGSFLALSGPDFCAPCSAGRFSEWLYTETGTYTSGVCSDCEPGFSNEPGSSWCAACPMGKYGLGGGPCEECPAGTYTDVAGFPKCIRCELGHYQDLTGSTACEMCPPGELSNVTGLSECLLCPQGRDSWYGARECDECSEGMYTEWPGDLCKACPYGTYTNVTGTTECTSCEPGRAVKNEHFGATACNVCPPGYEADEPGMPLCQHCRPGRFTARNGTSACEACPKGSYSDTIESTSCMLCEVGFFSYVEAAEECIHCLEGTEGLTEGLSLCINCAPGQSRAGNETNCTACEAGKYAPRPGTDYCTECSPGDVSGPGAFECDACETGRYNGMHGQSACLLCENGTFAVVAGQTQCWDCPAGYAAGEMGMVECDACPKGTFAAEEAATECTLCSAGTYNPMVEGQHCIDCDVGTYAEEGASECVPCSAGTYQPLTGRSSCLVCAVGQYSNAPAAEDCLPCDVGEFADALGTTACTSCANVSNRSGLGSLWKTLMPVGTEVNMKEVIGAVNESFCGCAPGSQPVGNACEYCGEGLACYGMDNIYVLKGYAADGNGNVYDCRNGVEEACPGGLPGVCAPGRDTEVVGCALCMDGMVPQNDGSCAECRGADYLIPAACLVVLLVGLLIIYCMFDRPNQKRPSLTTLFILASAGQFVTIIQQLGVISLIRVTWVQPLLDIMEIVQSISFFDLQILRPTCVVEMDPLSMYVLRVFMVFGALLFILIAHCISLLLQHRGKWSRRFSSWFCAEGAVMLTFFVSIVSTMLGPLQCKRHPNGKETIAWYPSVLCWQGAEHTKMLLLGTGACLLPALFLAATSWAARAFPQRIIIGDMKFLNAWSFLFFRYNTGAYWYGPVILVRNALVAVAPVLTLAVHQVLFLEVLLVASLVMLLIVLPWRVLAANYLDAMGHVCMLCVTMIAAFYVEDSELPVVSTVSAVCICLVPCVLFGSCAYGVARLVEMKLKPYQFFLCHHKAAAGSFCRFMKMRLQKTPGVKTKIFIDTDDLRNLDGLFDVVAHQTGTLVVIHSGSVLLRPWCAGEITTACRSSVRTLSVYIDGVLPPTGEFIKKYSDHVPDLSILTPFGILVQDIQEALMWLEQQAAMYLPAEVREPVVDEVCTMLVSSLKHQATGRHIAKKIEQQPNKVRLLLMADEQDLEAISTALILRHLMIPRTVHMDRAIGVVWSSNSEIRPTVEKVVLICTNGIFNKPVVEALRKINQLKASILPVMSTTNFIFPSSSWMCRQPFIQDMEEDTAKETVRFVKNIFAEIAVDFQPSALSGTEATLQIKAEEIVVRLFGEAEELMCKKGQYSSARSDSRLISSTVTSSRSLFSPTASGMTSSRRLMSSMMAQMSNANTRRNSSTGSADSSPVHSAQPQPFSPDSLPDPAPKDPSAAPTAYQHFECRTSEASTPEKALDGQPEVGTEKDPSLVDYLPPNQEDDSYSSFMKMLDKTPHSLLDV